VTKRKFDNIDSSYLYLLNFKTMIKAYLHCGENRVMLDCFKTTKYFFRFFKMH